MTAICDHGTPVDEVGAAQRVGDQRRFGVRRGDDAHPHGAPAGRPPANSRAASTPGSRRAIPVMARATAGAQRCDSVGDHAVALTAQQRRVSTAVAEHRLVRVACDDGDFGARRQHPDQPGACGSRCCASSTNNTWIRPRSAGSSSASVANASRAAPISSAAPRAGTVACGAAIPTAERSSMTCS